MSHKFKKGDIVHWTMVWQQPIDAWVQVIDADKVEVIYGTATAKNNKLPITWEVGSTTHILGHSPHIGIEYVPPDEVPDEVLVALAKRALLGDSE